MHGHRNSSDARSVLFYNSVLLFQIRQAIYKLRDRHQPRSQSVFLAFLERFGYKPEIAECGGRKYEWVEKLTRYIPMRAAGLCPGFFMGGAEFFSKIDELALHPTFWNVMETMKQIHCSFRRVILFTIRLFSHLELKINHFDMNTIFWVFASHESHRYHDTGHSLGLAWRTAL